jgi:hypothetical protein
MLTATASAAPAQNKYSSHKSILSFPCRELYPGWVLLQSDYSSIGPPKKYSYSIVSLFVTVKLLPAIPKQDADVV